MKKTSITSQLVILFVLILLLSATAFTTLTLSRIHMLAEEETYSRLMTYSSLLDAHNQNPEQDLIDFPDMEIAYIKVSANHILSSQDVQKYLSKDDFNYIIEHTNQNVKPNLEFCKIKNFEGETLYYVTAIREGSIAILMTNSAYVKHMLRTVSVQLVLIFLAITCLAVLGIGAWSNRFVRRIHHIQNQILDLSNIDEAFAYTDSSFDEIGELSRTVEKMKIEIRKGEETKQEMLQNISHDFKTPIAVIKSYAEAQQDGMADEDSSRIIINQAEILKHKVNRLLQYNSLEYLKKDREFEDVDMKKVIEEVVNGYKFQMDLQIELDLADQIYFKGYQENYFIIVDNILDNSKRYAKTKIKIVLRKDRLRIYNDGEAIDEVFIKNSFKPYEKGSKGEFGLGMSIVKKTVEFFGMNLIVKNEPIGVSFIITKK